MSQLKYRRLLLKLSGEALMGDGDFGIDPGVISRVAQDIKELVEAGLQLGLVIGGGNIFRGAGLAQGGLDRVTGDHMGMLATVMNALAMKDALKKAGLGARVMSAIKMNPVCEDFSRDEAVRCLEAGEVVLFAAGTGNPFFTTDTAASLRAVEIGADLMIKATKVNGVYSADPVKNPTATMYDNLSFADVLKNDLRVMDHAAISLCRESKIDIIVCNLLKPGHVEKVVRGEPVGTVISEA